MPRLVESAELAARGQGQEHRYEEGLESFPVSFSSEEGSVLSIPFFFRLPAIQQQQQQEQVQQPPSLQPNHRIIIDMLETEIAHLPDNLQLRVIASLEAARAHLAVTAQPLSLPPGDEKWQELVEHRLCQILVLARLALSWYHMARQIPCISSRGLAYMDDCNTQCSYLDFCLQHIHLVFAVVFELENAQVVNLFHVASYRPFLAMMNWLFLKTLYLLQKRQVTRFFSAPPMLQTDHAPLVFSRVLHFFSQHNLWHVGFGIECRMFFFYECLARNDFATAIAALGCTLEECYPSLANLPPVVGAHLARAWFLLGKKEEEERGGNGDHLEQVRVAVFELLDWVDEHCPVASWMDFTDQLRYWNVVYSILQTMQHQEEKKNECRRQVKHILSRNLLCNEQDIELEWQEEEETFQFIVISPFSRVQD